MKTRKSKLGVDHPEMLASMNNLAFAFKAKAEEGNAIRLMEECVGRQKRILGPDHLYTKGSEDTLNSWRMGGLGLGSPSGLPQTSSPTSKQQVQQSNAPPDAPPDVPPNKAVDRMEGKGGGGLCGVESQR